MPSWREAPQAISVRPGRDIAITLDRSGRASDGDGRVRGRPLRSSEIGVRPDTSPAVQSVGAGEPADRAGVKKWATCCCR